MTRDGHASEDNVRQTELASIVNALLDEQPFPSENDRQFFRRVFNSGDLSKYQARIKAIGFRGKNRILDAGCGFSQWAFALSEMNNSIVGIDVDKFRIDIAKDLAHRMGIHNLQLCCQALSQTSFKDNEFDGIFSYNAITLSPYRETLSLFHRLLAPGGHLYFNAADLGWFIYNIIEQHNPTSDFSPRQWAIETITHTIKYFATGRFHQSSPRDSVLMPVDIVKDDLLALGFDIIAIAGDGEINIHGDKGSNSFFPANKYNMPAVYEVLARKR